MARLVTDTDRRTILKTKLNLVHENKNNPEGPKVQSNLNCTIQQLHYIILKKFSTANFVRVNNSEIIVEKKWTQCRGGARNFCLGGPSATLIHLLRQLPHTYIYTYARFFIIYTHFLFDKLYIYTQPKKKKFSIFNQNYF